MVVVKECSPSAVPAEMAGHAIPTLRFDFESTDYVWCIFTGAADFVGGVCDGEGAGDFEVVVAGDELCGCELRVNGKMGGYQGKGEKKGRDTRGRWQTRRRFLCGSCGSGR